MARGEMNKRTPVILIKKFSYGEKEIYRGILRKAQRMIPPSKKKQYKIIVQNEEEE